jgi:hypothetical protein
MNGFDRCPASGLVSGILRKNHVEVTEIRKCADDPQSDPQIQIVRKSLVRAEGETTALRKIQGKVQKKAIIS